MWTPYLGTFVVLAPDNSIALMLTWNYHNINSPWKPQAFRTELFEPSRFHRVDAYGTQVACYEVEATGPPRVCSAKFYLVEGTNTLAGSSGAESWGCDVYDEFGCRHLSNHFLAARQRFTASANAAIPHSVTPATLAKWTRRLLRRPCLSATPDIHSLSPKLVCRQLPRVSVCINQVRSSTFSRSCAV